VGKAKAMDLCLTGRMMDAEEAERSGLVSRVVSADQLINEAIKAAETIAAKSMPIVMMTKESVNRSYETTLTEGVRFERRVFTGLELEQCRSRADRGQALAARFAAKEACAKALGTGVPRRGVHWRHMGVVNLPSGAPTLALTHGAERRLAEITPVGLAPRISLTLTDDYPWAQALVIIEAYPLPQEG